MTWNVNISGHDDLSGEEKEKLENVIVGEIKALVHSLMAQEGCRLTTATVNTNTTGVVNILDPTENDI